MMNTKLSLILRALFWLVFLGPCVESEDSESCTAGTDSDLVDRVGKLEEQMAALQALDLVKAHEEALRAERQRGFDAEGGLKCISTICTIGCASRCKWSVHERELIISGKTTKEELLADPKRDPLQIVYDNER